MRYLYSIPAPPTCLAVLTLFPPGCLARPLAIFLVLPSLEAIVSSSLFLLPVSFPSWICFCSLCFESMYLVLCFLLFSLAAVAHSISSDSLGLFHLLCVSLGLSAFLLLLLFLCLAATLVP